MCPKCSARFFFDDGDGPACLTCGFREPATTLEEAQAELAAVRAKSGSTDNYRRYRPATHAHKTLERYQDLQREARKR